MLSPLFDEAAADKEVIKSLSKEIERLKKITMSKIIKSTDGKFYRVHSFEEVSQEEVAGELAQAQAFASELEGLLPAAAPAPADNLSEEPANAPTDEPAVPAPAEPVAEAAAPSPEPVAEQPAVAAEFASPPAPEAEEQPATPAPLTLQ